MKVIESVLMNQSDEQGGGGPKEKSLPVTDLELALERVGGDKELLCELAVLFLDDYPRQLGIIAGAVASGDLKTAEREAHSVKGAVANFGAAEAEETAGVLEMAARQGKRDELGPGLDLLRRSLSRVHEALERFSSKPG